MEYIKLNETTISIILGALVVIIVGVLVVNYFKENPDGTPTKEMTEKEFCIEKYSNWTSKDTPNKCIKYFFEGGE